MKSSNLKDKYLKSKSKTNRQRFVKQINLYVCLSTETKGCYYSNLNEKNVIDNQKSLKTVNQYFQTNLSIVKRLH